MEKKVQKITINQIIWYLIIFSILGLLIETIFCYITTGVLESRKGLIWGPFCPVYGVGATILIILLNRYNEKPIQLFIAGSIMGNIIEYSLSYILEAMYGARFWDYSYLNWNLNGRICITYSIFWGILAVILIKMVKPIIDKIINKIPNNEKINITIIILILIDSIATVWAVKTYQNRIISNNSQNKKNKIIQYIENTLFSNEKMKKTFPNLRYIDETGKEHYIRDMI
ncbi:MAG: putative ABC transporter permease [Clostridia bacterium]|nr:putative ABC transporter permease [Clostridia bacterium]